MAITIAAGDAVGQYRPRSLLYLLGQICVIQATTQQSGLSHARAAYNTLRHGEAEPTLGRCLGLAATIALAVAH
eukprot:1653342-Rhodomonas_salina.1